MSPIHEGARVLLRGRGGRVLDEGVILAVGPPREGAPPRLLIRWTRPGGLRITRWMAPSRITVWEAP